MTKRVLDVGNCAFDHRSVRTLIESRFDAEVIRCRGLDDTLRHLRAGRGDLVLINRKLSQDNRDGLDVLKAIKADPQLAEVPVMLITNYERYQQEAMQHGALRGFGKAQLNQPETHQRLEQLLA